MVARKPLLHFLALGKPALTHGVAQLPVGPGLLLQDAKRVVASRHGKAHSAAGALQQAPWDGRGAVLVSVLVRQLALGIAAAAPQLPLLPGEQAVRGPRADLLTCQAPQSTTVYMLSDFSLVCVMDQALRPVFQIVHSSCEYPFSGNPDIFLDDVLAHLADVLAG